MMKHIGLVISIAILSTGCVSVSQLPEYNSDTASVTVYRSGQLQGSAVKTYIGWDNQSYVILASHQYTKVNVPEGFQTFTIKAHADLSNELTLEIEKGDTVCLMAEVNPQNIVGLNWFVSGYQLRQISCLNEEQAKPYIFVPSQI